VFVLLEDSIGVSVCPVGRFYRNECSETVRVGRVHVFEEFLTMFDYNVLTFGVQ
jgi:hypothetical protein